MAPPAWLPPLNSHENSIVDVYICQAPNYHTDTQRNYFYIRLDVWVTFHSEDDVEMKTELPGLALRIIKFINVKNPQLLNTSLRELFFDDDNVPFQVEDFFYREQNFRANPNHLPWSHFWDKNKLIEKLTNFIHWVVRKPENAGQKVLAVHAVITKTVKVPNEEFRSWIDWYDEQKRVHPDFEDEYWKAITVPRDQGDLLDEAESLTWRRSAGRDIVEELESVVLNGDEDDNGGDSSEKSCSICLEGFCGGVRATRLPCRHVFHENCVARWLSENHVCPLCRHSLPVDD